eukprot:651581-Pelagomonas_calceolata.AAC.1
MSSLRRGHANLLCIVPILTYVPKGSYSLSVHSLVKAGPVNLLGEALASLLVRGPFLNARSWTWLA